jgi:hypothetical protein
MVVSPAPRRLAASPVVLLGIALNVLAALVLPFASPVGEPRAYCYSWTYDPTGRRIYGPARAPDLGPGGRGCTSDVVTPAEAALGLGAAAVALAVGVRLPRASYQEGR